MAQAAVLIEALKKTLKQHGRTYADVAAALDLSTPSVKRLFAEKSLSLARLDAICALLDMEVTDLLRQVAGDGWQLSQLTVEQETAIAGDMPLLLVTVAVLNGLGMDDILERFHITEHECIRKLAWLDREGLIDLLPKSRIKLRVAANFAWRPDGPIQRFFQSRLSADYFSTRFAAEGERLLVLNGLLTPASLLQFHRRMEKLAQEFDELNAEDAVRPVDERSGHTVVLAVRPWVFGVFADYLRER